MQRANPPKGLHTVEALSRRPQLTILPAGAIVINHQRKRLSLPLEKTPQPQAVRNSGGANEEVCFGVTARCGGSRHATGYCSRARRALFQGHEVVRMREASRRHVSMLQSNSQVRLFTRPARLQALTTSAAGRRRWSTTASWPTQFGQPQGLSRRCGLLPARPRRLRAPNSR